MLLQAAVQTLTALIMDRISSGFSLLRLGNWYNMFMLLEKTTRELL